MVVLLDALPLWGFSLVTVVVTCVSFECGRRFGRRRSGEGEAALATPVGAGMGLLAFFLAFTFGVAASRFENRRQLVLEEANAIGTAYLRAKLVSEPHASEIQRILREYTDARIEAARSGNLKAATQRSAEMHERLWSEAGAVTQSEPRQAVVGLLVTSLNEVIDLHEMRVTAALQSRIPARVWDVLVLLTVLVMMAMGYQTGQQGMKVSPVILLLALAFSSVIYVIADLDRPLEGSLRVSQQPLLDTRESMGP
jgi:hypothetical protein